MTKLYLGYSTPIKYPTAGKKSIALPGSGADTGAFATPDLALTVGFGVVNPNISWTYPLTSHFDKPIARFSSPMLSAQTFGAGTWTMAFMQYSGGATTQYHVSLYIWRTSSVVGYIYDAHVALGNVWADNQQLGRVFTIIGSDVIIQEGDILVLEVWAHASGNAGSYGWFFMGGTREPIENSGYAGGYISTPTTILFYSPSIPSSAFMARNR